MINLYDNNIEDNILGQMYNILIENLFITYPDFLKEKINMIIKKIMIYGQI